MTQKVLVTSVCLLSIICVYVTYLWLDITITRNYELKSAEVTETAFRLTAQLLEHEWLGVTVDEVLEKIENTETFTGVIVVNKIEDGNGDLWLGSVRFKFENSKLKSIGEVQE